MSLLLDHNVSYKLKNLLRDIYPDIKHVTDVGLTEASDLEILGFANKSSACIVSFDSDFTDLVTFYKMKVKVVWLRSSNTSTKALANLLRDNQKVISDFLNNTDTLFLEVR